MHCLENDQPQTQPAGLDLINQFACAANAGMYTQVGIVAVHSRDHLGDRRLHKTRDHPKRYLTRSKIADRISHRLDLLDADVGLFNRLKEPLGFGRGF